MAGAIAQDRERCQFPFVLDEKPTVVAGGSVGKRSRRARKVPYRAARSNSERAAPSACVGKRFSAVQIVWNRSTRRARAARRDAGRQAQMAEDLARKSAGAWHASDFSTVHTKSCISFLTVLDFVDPLATLYLLAQRQRPEQPDNPDPDVLGQEIVEDLEAALKTIPRNRYRKDQ